jgi:1-acyl-sn-glycerol-3-phosphate acyltransferase
MDDTIINSRCVCKIGLPWNNKIVVMVEPCQHMFHLECLNKKKHCPICATYILNVLRIRDLGKNPVKFQQIIDILSMTNYDDKDDTDIVNCIDTSLYITYLAMKIPFSKGIDEGVELCANVLSLVNANIVTSGLNKIQHKNKVFIANHTCFLDVIVLTYILKSAYVSSSSIKDSFIGKCISDIFPMLLIDRGASENTVVRMKEYVKKNGSICLFPEGMMTHPKTLIRFRTGAFNVGYPVYPVVVTYDPIVADQDMGKFMLKLCSRKQIKINVTILDPVYPPFDDEQIEDVRRSMANAGNLLLSRVSNRDLKD